jgi:catechol 2,3-dioxygenase-like lactoylglutathione lyase family enzyme
MQDSVLSLKTKIFTRNLDETRRFYERVFGMVLVEEWDDADDKGVILAFSKERLGALLEIYDDASVRDYSGLSLQFRVTDIAKFQTELPDGLKYDGPKARPWGSQYIYIRDPNNIPVIVYEGGL